MFLILSCPISLHVIIAIFVIAIIFINMYYLIDGSMDLINGFFLEIFARTFLWIMKL